MPAGDEQQKGGQGGGVPARFRGIPVPYLSRAIMLPTVASRFSLPTPSGKGAVNRSPQRLQRSFCKE
jgi:hypothetical protein